MKYGISMLLSILGQKLVVYRHFWSGIATLFPSKRHGMKPSKQKNFNKVSMSSSKATENSKLFDPKVPDLLCNTQKWFASIITRPLCEKNSMNQTSPQGVPMEEEAKQFIAPSPTLQS